MSAPTTASIRSIFELKSATLPVVAVLLKSANAYEVAQALQERFADEPEFFDNDAVILDLSAIRELPQIPDFEILKHALVKLQTIPVSVRNASPEQMEAARLAGLSVAPDVGTARPEADADAAVASPVAPEPVVEIREVVREVEVVRESPAPETVLIDRPLRSGQQVYAKGADLIVTAVVNFGAEVIADGHVHVYAPLRGRAIAGARGNANARIFTSCMEAQLVSVAGIYRTAENELPANISGKPTQIRLEGERLLFEPLNLG
ncbi:septum site-determining protein MinC [Lampropedia hyalina DSM 16112]|jgi:septum site-determining protein MinC|uniref:Probable septum site-determining protein MinC n=1 Tax=Lampropedia hyalina DSM 16112 TaxID=1122156 RepID=A0A1M4VTM9_9BURK|nr:septum site-determining protein MinC [Lampropedia hyalina]SHE72220.1 septum site-determining protein MinC [Lampropedia hyalina DSM 16112]